MLFGKIARVCAAFVVCAQVITSVAVVAILPSSQTIARASEAPQVLEASDRPADRITDDSAVASSLGDGEFEFAREEGALSEEVADVLTERDQAFASEEVEQSEQPEQSSLSEEVAVEGSLENSSFEESFDEQFDANLCESSGSAWYSSDELRSAGLILDGTCAYTWYSQQVLPGGGLDIEGRHVTSDGYVADAHERIVVASSDLTLGTEIDVPFGGGKAVVLDTGCAPGVIDVYTNF